VVVFDFGDAKAVVTVAGKPDDANVGFNATHQKIVFTVTRRFYELNTARQKVEVAESSVRAAQTVHNRHRHASTMDWAPSRRASGGTTIGAGGIRS